MTIDLTSFDEIEFPQHRDIVYVLYFILDTSKVLVPFYVGESSRHVGRFGDYLSANFSASTDFKVGEAIKYLRKRGARIIVKFKESHNRREDEKFLLHSLRSSVKLLNDLSGYRYEKANIDHERKKIHLFIDEILTASKTNKIATKLKVSKNRSPDSSLTNINLGNEPSIPERIQLICQELAAKDRIIHRKDILRLAKERGINQGSVLPADYCDNTVTGKWSRYTFLHSIGPGRYVLR